MEEEEKAAPETIGKKYMHLGNGGFTFESTLWPGKFEHIDLKFGIGHLGCVNSEIKITSSEFDSHFVNSDQVLEMAVELLKTAQALRELEKRILEKNASSKHEHIKNRALKRIHSLEFQHKNLAKRDVLNQTKESLESFCTLFVKKEERFGGDQGSLLDLLDNPKE